MLYSRLLLLIVSMIVLGFGLMVIILLIIVVCFCYSMWLLNGCMNVLCLLSVDCVNVFVLV